MYRNELALYHPRPSQYLLIIVYQSSAYKKAPLSKNEGVWRCCFGRPNRNPGSLNRDYILLIQWVQSDYDPSN
ncbi:hypothetical protein AG1IA_07208 [Rhizoctonia solani AG-1 IA]|uniref:Uncharacterized protein n=1 Tax=Thanatephorus cucumeris (strain AG1-IA) TaxID=983506 RepID=L8WPU5_THACA|nr:hypothetical protein AG1IA_07208 [Rhizoctonia solani AG-1 IA]